MKRLSTLLLLFFGAFSLGAQTANPTDQGGGDVRFQSGPCFPPAKRAVELATLKETIGIMVENGTLIFDKSGKQIGLEWPLHKAAGFDDPGYYQLTNFVDHNANSPNQIIDYNCGSRTYDDNTGYNHQGTDIALWPFAWNLVNADMVEVVAAADGTITQKIDGNVDTNCNFSNPNWNVIYLTHSDGSSTIYGHLKNGSLTAKPVGATVTKGEYLGIVASSGASTGPHLHFEVVDINFELIDPYSGTCNNTNATTWWTNQPDYYEPTINAIRTGSAVPGFQPCPSEDVTNEKNCFNPGETIVFSDYYHDEIAGLSATSRVLRQDGSVFATWTRNSLGFHLPASYWFRQYTIPGGEADGWWTYEVSFEGQLVTHQFTVQADCSEPLPPLPIQMTYFKGRKEGKGNILEWQTMAEWNNDFFMLERSRDNESFQQYKRIEGKGTSNSVSNYDFLDREPFFGTTYYRLRQVDVEGKYTFSNVVAIKNDLGREFQVIPTLVTNEVNIRYENNNALDKVVVFDAVGRVLMVEESFEEPKQKTIDLSGISKGVLFITIYKGNGEVETQRIFKK